MDKKQLLVVELPQRVASIQLRVAGIIWTMERGRDKFAASKNKNYDA
jgi:hypothetical protein